MHFYRFSQRTLLAALLLPTLLKGATVTWDSGGADDNYDTAANWVGDAVPASGDDLVFDAGSDGGDADTDVTLNQSYTVGSITFAGGAPAMTLATESWNDWLLVSGGIVNNSTATQTFYNAFGAVPVEIIANSTLHAAAGDLVLNGNGIELKTFQLTVDGAFNTTLNNIWLDAAPNLLTKNGDGTLTISGQINDDDGGDHHLDLALNDGTVVAGSFATIFGDITVADGATYRMQAGGNTVLGDSITLTGTGHNNAGALHYMSNDRLDVAFGLAADATIRIDTGLANNTRIGNNGTAPLDLNGHNLTIEVGTDAFLATVLDEAGTITKTGDAKLTVNPSTNVYKGDLYIEAGMLEMWNVLFDPNSTSNTLSVKNGGSIDFNQAEDIETILLEGGATVTDLDGIGLATDATVTLNTTASGAGTAVLEATGAWNALYQLEGNTLTITVPDNANTGDDTNIDLELGGEVASSSAATFIKEGNGTLHVRWDEYDTDVAFQINAGTVLFEDGRSVANSDQDITVAAGATAAAQFDFENAGFSNNNFIDNIADASAGVIALAADCTKALDMSNKPSMNIGAIVVGTDDTHAFTGTITGAAGNVIRLGGGGGILDMQSDFSTDTSDSVVIDTNNTESSSVVRYSVAQDYTGNTTIFDGTLQLGASHVISDTSNFTIGGGTLDTAGNDEVVGTLILTDNFVINLGSADSVLEFAALSYLTGTVQVWNWTGTADTAGGTDQLRFTSTFGTNLDKFQFYSDNGVTPIGNGATFIGNELVPTGSAASGFDSWITGFGLSVPDQDRLADPDNDGLDNLIEYALGLTPNSSDANGAFTVTRNGARLELTFHRDPTLTDIHYIVEAGASTTSFSTTLYDSNGDTFTAGNHTVSDDTDIAVGAPRFIRLKVADL